MRALWRTLGSIFIAASCATLAARYAVFARPSPVTRVAPILARSEQQGPLDAAQVFVGVIVAAESVDVSFHAEGRIEQVHVRLGDAVTKGQPLATLATQQLHAELRMARASLDAAVADVERATLDGKHAESRYQRRILLTEGVPAISIDEIESARYQAALAKPQLNSAKAALAERTARVEQLQDQLRSSELKAPFAGVVAVRYRDPGVVVERGTPILRLISSSETWVRFAAPENVATEVAPGRSVRLAVDGTNTQLKGTIEKVSPELDPASRLVVAEALVSVPPSTGMQIMGRTARVQLHSD